MEAKNMELNPLNEANENQLRYMVKYLTVELETMKTVCQDNSILQTKTNIYKLKGEENVNNNSLNKEIIELRKQLKIRKELSEAWKDEQEHILKLEEQLEAKERELLRQLPYQKECLQLRKKNRDLKVAMRQQEKQLMEKTHFLKLEVAELQEEISKLQRKNVKLQEEKYKLQEETSKEHQHELAQKQRALLTEKKCSELEKQLRQTLRELYVKMPPNKRAESCSDAPFDVAMLYDKHIEVVRQLIVERNRLERKDHIIKEKEKQIEELKHSVSRPLPFEANPESQWVSREQSKTISALTAQVHMLYSKADEDKREREKLADEVGAIKKKYLNGRMQNTDLREALRRSGANQVPGEKSGDIQVPPPSSTGLRRQSGEKRVNAKMQPAEPMPFRLPHIGNSFCPEQSKNNQTHQYKMS